MRLVNLGSGMKNRKDWINIDSNPNCGATIVRDITKGLPFDDCSVDEFYADNFLEHINPEDIGFVMEEIWRCGKPNTILDYRLPYGDLAFRHPDHRWFPQPEWWIVFGPDAIPNNNDCNFDMVKQFVVTVDGGEELQGKLRVVKDG